MYKPPLPFSLLLCLLPGGLGACGEEAPPEPPAPTACADHLDCTSSEFCASKVCTDAAGQRHDLGGGTHAHLVLDARSGTFNLYSPQKKLLLREAYAYAALDGHKTELRSTKLTKPKVNTSTAKDELGDHQALVVTYEDSASVSLIWRAAYYKKSGAFVFRLGLKNNAAAKVVVDKLAPVRSRGNAGGGLFLGAHPRTHRILENGASGLTDHYAALEMGDKAKDGITYMAPGKLEGHSASNWSHLIWDSKTGLVWMAGALTTERAITVMNTTYDAKDYKLADGRVGFGFYSLEALYLPQGKPVKPGAELQSEHFYLHPTQTGVHSALEDYAQAMHDKQGLVTWIDRGLRVPNGWNSWAGSGGTGGYGTAIDQTLMEKNLAVMRDYFRDWGMDYFQMDDGWELDYGDWTINTKRFPDGFSPKKGIVKKTLDAKMKPGIWIAGFSAYTSSQLYKTYYPKGWFMPPTLYGKLVLSEYKMLDLSNPEVLKWLEALFRRVHDDWGFRWLKLDFSYPALLCQDFHDSTLTNVEVYDKGLAVLRKAMGTDSFFLNIGSIGVGSADSKRVTLDNAPVWDWDSERNSMPIARQGFKPTMATSARRYFYQGKVWITHPDLIIFRSDTKNLKLPRITFKEARAFCAFVAATGGIVKLGDRLVEDLAPYPERVNTIRQLLPIHPQPARPLDVMTREFPEQWFKKIQSTLGGYNETWGWYVAMNLGLNWDYTQNPATQMPDDGKARSYTVDPVALGLESGVSYHLFEFWDQAYVGLKTGKFQVTVPSHDSRIYALRAKQDNPQFLGHNRHITMGAAVLKGVVWDKAASTLTVTMEMARANKEAKFIYKLSFHGNGRAFKGLSFLSAKPEGVTTTVKDGVLQVQLTPAANGELKMVLEYK